MKTNTRSSRLLFAALVIGFAAAGAQAQITVPGSLSQNATIQPGGPRSGSNGVTFLNIEGSNNGNFASFGIIDFTLPATSTAASVTGLSLSLFQSNAAFSATGGFNIYLTQNTSTAFGSLMFQGTDGIGAQLTPNHVIGSGTFTPVSSGTQDTFNLTSLSTDDVTYLNNVYTNGGTIRLVLAPTDPGVAATYGGNGNSNGSPALLLNAAPVPEPSTYVMLGVAGIGALVLRRKLALA